MATAPPEWRKHYVAAFDRDTRKLTFEMKGILIALSDAWWLGEGSLPTDIDEICRCIGAPTSKAMKEKIQLLLGRYFKVDDTGYTNVELETNFAAARKKSAQATAAVNTRWHGHGEEGGGLDTDADTSAYTNVYTDVSQREERKRSEDQIPEERSSSSPDLSQAPERAKKRARRAALSLDVSEITEEQWHGLALARSKRGKPPLTHDEMRYCAEKCMRTYASRITNLGELMPILTTWVEREEPDSGKGQKAPENHVGAIRVFRIGGSQYPVYPYTHPGQKDAQYRLAQSLGIQIGTIQYRPGPAEYQQKLLDKLAALEAAEADSGNQQ